MLGGGLERQGAKEIPWEGGGTPTFLRGMRRHCPLQSYSDLPCWTRWFDRVKNFHFKYTLSIKIMARAAQHCHCSTQIANMIQNSEVGQTQG